MRLFLACLLLAACSTATSGATVSVWGMPPATVKRAIATACKSTDCTTHTIRTSADTLLISGPQSRALAQAIAAALAN